MSDCHTFIVLSKVYGWSKNRLPALHLGGLGNSLHEVTDCPHVGRRMPGRFGDRSRVRPDQDATSSADLPNVV